MGGPVSQVVGRYVILQEAGKEFRGQCPFHEDERQSLFVNDRFGWYHCFGCLAHGNGPKFEAELARIDKEKQRG